VGGNMIIVEIVFWLFTIPYILIGIGVVWLWVLSLIGRMFGGSEK
jgi:hypothetical protein